jgi:hypothetical protein
MIEECGSCNDNPTSGCADNDAAVAIKIAVNKVIPIMLDLKDKVHAFTHAYDDCCVETNANLDLVTTKLSTVLTNNTECCIAINAKLKAIAGKLGQIQDGIQPVCSTTTTTTPVTTTTTTAAVATTTTTTIPVTTTTTTQVTTTTTTIQGSLPCYNWTLYSGGSHEGDGATYDYTECDGTTVEYMVAWEQGSHIVCSQQEPVLTFSVGEPAPDPVLQGEICGLYTTTTTTVLT